ALGEDARDPAAFHDRHGTDPAFREQGDGIAHPGRCFALDDVGTCPADDQAGNIHGIRPPSLGWENAMKRAPLPIGRGMASWDAMTSRSPLDDPDKAAFAWGRYKRLMRAMVLVTLVVVALGLGSI